MLKCFAWLCQSLKNMGIMVFKWQIVLFFFHFYAQIFSSQPLILMVLVQRLHNILDPNRFTNEQICFASWCCCVEDLCGIMNVTFSPRNSQCTCFLSNKFTFFIDKNYIWTFVIFHQWYAPLFIQAFRIYSGTHYLYYSYYYNQKKMRQFWSTLFRCGAFRAFHLLSSKLSYDLAV